MWKEFAKSIGQGLIQGAADAIHSVGVAQATQYGTNTDLTQTSPPDIFGEPASGWNYTGRQIAPAIGVMVGSATFTGAPKLPLAGDFFTGTKYSSKVLSQMRQNDYHAFLESAKVFQGSGKVGKVTGGDGAVRDTLNIPGGYKGKEGSFEFIKEPDGIINHRFFNPD